MNLNNFPWNAEVVGSDRQFSVPWKQSLNQLYTYVLTLGTSGSSSGITSLTGAVTATGPGAAAASLSSTGVTAGSYTNTDITVGVDGRVTAAASGSGGGGGGSGITALTGDVTATGTGSVPATLANTAVTPGSYKSTNLTVDSKGRLIAAASGLAGTYNRGASWPYGSLTITSISQMTNVSCVSCPKDSTITQWEIVTLGGSGSVEFDVWKGGVGVDPDTLTAADSICAGAYPAISGGSYVSSTTMTGWTLTALVGQTYVVHPRSVSGTYTSILFAMRLRET